MALLQLSLLFLFQLLPRTRAAAVVTFPPAYCSPGALPVQFPFLLRGQNLSRQCGYPGFRLSCSNRTQTVLRLPDMGDFSVEEIHYPNQTLWLNDPDSCLPGRLLNFTLSSSPRFRAVFPREITFLNCSSNTTIASAIPMLKWVPCLELAGQSYLVAYVPTTSMIEASVSALRYGCQVIAKVSVPVAAQHASDLNDGILLAWDEPDCRSCLARRGTCGLKDGPGTVVGCSNGPTEGLPRSAKYGIIVGLGIPALLCIIGFACYLGGRITAYGRNPPPDVEFSITVVPSEPCAVRGLDGSTIASYPETRLGESKRLPKPNDNTCPICLCEYQAKETLRTIPECGHYFHADCIDEWLKMNATCPLCRNTPSETASTTRLVSGSSASSSHVPT